MNKNIYFFAGFAILIIGILAMGVFEVEGEDTEVSYGGMYKTVSAPSFAETGWRDIEDWEIEQCSKKLSTEIENDVYAQTGTPKDGLSYGTSITLQGLKTEYYGEMFYEVAWYINPTLDNVTFSIVAYNDRAGDLLIVIPSTEIGKNQGGAYYEAWQDEQNYTKIKLVSDDGQIDIDFVKKGI